MCLEAWIGSQTGGMAISAKPHGCRKSNHLHWMKVVVGDCPPVMVQWNMGISKSKFSLFHGVIVMGERIPKSELQRDLVRDASNLIDFAVFRIDTWI